MKGSHDIFQVKMVELKATHKFVRVYIDGILCIIYGSFEDDLNKLRQILTKLQDSDLTAHLCKCLFCAEELNILPTALHDMD